MVLSSIRVIVSNLGFIGLIENWLEAMAESPTLDLACLSIVLVYSLLSF